MGLLRSLTLLLLLCCGLAALECPAQTGQSKAMRQAHSYRLRKQNDKAIAALYKAIGETPADAEVYSTLGAWLSEQNRFAEAASVLEQGSRNTRRGHTAFCKPLARTLIRAGQPAQAENVLQSCRPAATDAEWDLLLQQARFAAQATRKPVVDSLEPMGPRINTPDPEMFPWLSADTQQLYFTRRVRGIDEDFFRAVPDSCGGWLSARNLGSPPNTPQQEAAQMISADRHYLFFMRCDNKSENGWESGGCDLYMAYTADSTWSVPESFGGTINSPGYEGMPCLSSDNKELFFVSNRPGGYGGLDLWVTTFRQGLWQQPRNLGPEVNTPGNETAPFLHPDNRTLYFVSDGHPGMGGMDLYRCSRGIDTLWNQVQNLGYPLNTGYDESGIFVRPDGSKAIISSDRQGPAGNFDLYEVRLPQALQPRAVTYVQGHVRDSISGSRLNYAHLNVYTAESELPLFEYQSNRGDGSFMMILQPGTPYLLLTDRMGYQERTDTLLFPTQTLAEPAQFSVALLPSDYQKPQVDTLVLSIRYQRNITTIDDSVRKELARILAPYIGKEEASVVINSYTDNTGTPVVNDQISDLRARIIAGEVEKLGFQPHRVQWQGWAEANPLVSNDTEENRYLNRRVEVIIRQ